MSPLYNKKKIRRSFVPGAVIWSRLQAQVGCYTTFEMFFFYYLFLPHGFSKWIKIIFLQMRYFGLIEFISIISFLKQVSQQIGSLLYSCIYIRQMVSLRCGLSYVTYILLCQVSLIFWKNSSIFKYLIDFFVITVNTKLILRIAWLDICWSIPESSLLLVIYATTKQGRNLTSVSTC